MSQGTTTGCYPQFQKITRRICGTDRKPSKETFWWNAEAQCQLCIEPLSASESVALRQLFHQENIWKAPYILDVTQGFSWKRI